jgi:cellulose synthase/poly-beta-1,6-N-acetylglucosamine synthase-like glycosyltransferase
MEVNYTLFLKLFAYAVLTVYIGCLLMIFFYSLMQLNMLKYFLSYQKKKKEIPPPPKELPRITIQLPLYNEYYVVERLNKTLSKGISATKDPNRADHSRPT